MNSPRLTAVEAVAAALRLKATRDVLALLADSKTDREAGRKALLLAFMLDPALIGRQRELARRMGVTEGRASQMLKSLRRSLANKTEVRLTSR